MPKTHTFRRRQGGCPPPCGVASCPGTFLRTEDWLEGWPSPLIGVSGVRLGIELNAGGASFAAQGPQLRHLDSVHA